MSLWEMRLFSARRQFIRRLTALIGASAAKFWCPTQLVVAAVKPTPKPPLIVAPSPPSSFTSYSNIPDNTWVHVGPGSSSGPPQGIAAYSGMCIDDIHDQILMFGGGHQDYWGNEVWAWDINARTWQRMYVPDAFDTMTDAQIKAGIDNAGHPGMWMPYGRPITRHTYDSVEFISHLGVMIAGGNATYSRLDESLWKIWPNSPGDNWFYDFAANSWTYKGSSLVDQTRSGIGIAAYAPDMRKVITIGRDQQYQQQTWVYDPDANTWQQLFPSNPGVWNNEVALTYDTTRKYAVYFGGIDPLSNKLWAYDVTANTWLDLSPTAGPAPPAGWAYGVCYDNFNDVILIYGSSGLWVYDYARRQWTQGPSGPEPAAIHGKFKFDAKRNVAFLAYASSQGAIELWAYRYKSPAPASALPASSLNVLLTVGEALPPTTSSRARSSDPVTVGIPLPDAYNSVLQLGLKDASAAQFRPLAWWPSGNIKWVLCDFEASVAPGGTATVTFAGGTGNFGGPDLATDRGTTIFINTGIAQFSIKKARFNVFDSVIVNGVTLVSATTGELALWDATNAKWSSANDPSSTAIVEENGPVRCCIKATGSFKNASGARLADYTLRLHFYKDKGTVRGFYTLRNGDKNYPSALYFNALEAVVPLSLSGSLTATFSRKSDTLSQTLTPGQRGTLWQGFSMNWHRDEIIGADTWDPPVPGTFASPDYVYHFDQQAAGLEIIAGGTTLNALGNQLDWSQGYADLSGTNGAGVTVALRWMSAYWPAGFDFGADGSVSIELFSKRNPKKSLKLGMYRHEGREILWDFHDSANDKELALYRLQYPLVARAPLAHYRETKAIYGQTEFPTLAEQDQFFSDTGHREFRFNGTPDRDMEIFRVWPWGQGGGDNQIDTPLTMLTDYLRGGGTGLYLCGEQRTLFNALTAVGHSDVPYDPKDRNAPVIVDPNPNQKSINGIYFDTEHWHMLSMPFYYFLTGNEEVKEAVTHTAQGLMSSQWQNSYAMPQTPYFRAWNRKFRNIAVCHEFGAQTGLPDIGLSGLLRTCIDWLLDKRDNPALTTKSPWGRNLERGYIFGDIDLPSDERLGGNYTYRPVHALFQPQIHFEAAWQVLRVNRDTGMNYRVDEIEDYLHGLSRFYLDEFFDNTSIPNGPGATDVGFLYDYAIDYPYPSFNAGNQAPYNQTFNSLWPYDASRAALFAYYKTGNIDYLNKANLLVWRIAQYANSRNPSELQDQALIDAAFRKPKTWNPMSVTVTRSGQDCILSWSVPPGATQFQIKTSTKTIVEWLAFDRVTRTFQYDSGTNIAYYAAASVANVPQPSGSTQQLTVRGLPAGSQFSMKYL